MRLFRFDQNGRCGCGAADADGILRDVSSLWPLDSAAPSSAVIEELRRTTLTDFPVIETARLGACAGTFGKIVCVGLNYSDHATELGTPLPTEPLLFLKPGSSAAGPDADLIVQPGFTAVDWEVELGIVIGSTAKQIKTMNALDYVAGYCVVNDVTDRAWSSRDPSQWMKGKSADGFTSIGPWLVTRDEVNDPHSLSLWTDVNGIRYQSGNSKSMKFSVEELVSYVSQFTTLQPGDVISSGTPAGVGSQQKPPRYLRPGDVEAGISGLGKQTRRVI
jgi:2-keto-4-pentenoate hydratase/2-oxohepta-3-ene-1,7-dioic acid hydratase in catechol pathway